MLNRQEYRKLYDKISPSDDLIDKVMNIEYHHKKNHRFRYAAAIAAICITLIGGTSAYAVKNYAINQGFFGNELTSEQISKMYNKLDLDLKCGEYNFNFEGYSYVPEAHVGYLPIKITSKKGSAIDWKVGSDVFYYRDKDDKMKFFDTHYSSYVLDGTEYLMFNMGDARGCYSMSTQNEDGIYIYEILSDDCRDTFAENIEIRIVEKNKLIEMLNGHSFSDSEEEFDYVLSKTKDNMVSIDLSKANRDVAKYHTVNIDCVASMTTLFMACSADAEKLSDISVIEENGNTIDIVTDGKIIDNKLWYGPSAGGDDDKITELMYFFEKPIDPRTIKIKVNGKNIPYRF